MNSSLKQRLGIFAAICVVAVLFLYPTISVISKKLSGEEVSASEILNTNWISKPLALGLDLSGGVHLVYEVLAKEAVKSRMQAEAMSIRSELRDQKVPILKAVVNESDEIEFTLASERSLEKARQSIEQGRKLIFKSQDIVEGKPILRYGITEAEAYQIEDAAVSQAVESLRNRVDQFGVSEPLIQRVGSRRINLQMPGVKDIEAVKKVVGRVAKLEFRFLPRPGSGAGTVNLKDKSGALIPVEDIVQLTGAAVADARSGFADGQIEVNLTLTADGGRQFAKITGENVGRNLAIILDGVVYSSPVIRDRISGGSCSISGSFTLEEARQLSVVLRAGALPAPLKILEERSVGPTLGAESIRKGLMSMMIGFVAILIFMVGYYRKAGIVAGGTLLLNIFFILAALSAFGATLTLPGLAGIVLTVGMAVDANVLIYERIKEELAVGAGRDVAVNAGFEKALTAILDSNITTLLSGVIMYMMGSGPIKGFAVTLCVGILTTIFCATYVARLGFDTWSLKGARRGLSI